MNTVYVGQERVYVFGGRYFMYCDEAAEHVANAEWAQGVLSRPSVTFPNGRSSHVVASEVLDKAEDGLVDYMLIAA